jgi:hypothetical protein
VGDDAGAIVAGMDVGIVIGVLVGGGGGMVGVLKGTVWVKLACTVNAAAVKTTLGLLGSWVAALDGRLQAEIMSIKTLKNEITRKFLNIFSPQFAAIFYTNTDGQALPFVPTKQKNGSQMTPVSSLTKPQAVSLTPDSILRRALFFIWSAICGGRNASADDSSQDNDSKQVRQPGEEVVVDAWIGVLDTG